MGFRGLGVQGLGLKPRARALASRVAALAESRVGLCPHGLGFSAGWWLFFHWGGDC